MSTYKSALALTLKILAAICLAALIFAAGLHAAPAARIGDHDVPPLHCVEDNVLRLTPQGVQCADGGR